jgi:hypothetical protein
VLGHVISETGIEVDRAKVETVEQLPPPTDVKSLRSFLGHAGFYRRFIKDFSKITKPLTHLLQKNMANSTPSIFIKPTVAFNCGDTFVFGSWVCTADGAGSFQCRLTMPSNLKTSHVTLPEVVTGDLVGKFGEISLYNQHADFELGSDSNSKSTSPWAIACELVIEPSCADSLLHEHFPYGLFIASKAHAKALSARRAGKEIASEYD